MKTKRCYKCKTFKVIDEFVKDKTRPDGLAYICKSCRKMMFKKWYNPERGRNVELKRKFGITLEDWHRILHEQNHTCPICKSTNKKFVGDHDHETGLFRGIICSSCNRALAHFGDDLEKVKDNYERLIKYLEN